MISAHHKESISYTHTFFHSASTMQNDDDDAAVDAEDWLAIPVADDKEENQQQEDVTLSGTMEDS